MVKAIWNHVGIRWSAFCGMLIKHRAARTPSFTVFTFFFVHEGMLGLFEWNRARREIQCIVSLGFLHMWVFNKYLANVFCVHNFPSVHRSEIEFPMQLRHPICGTNRYVFFWMEEFVFAATRHVLVIVGGVLMEVRAACMMRRMTLNVGHE